MAVAIQPIHIYKNCIREVNYEIINQSNRMLKYNITSTYQAFVTSSVLLPFCPFSSKPLYGNAANMV
jgi:hypothetical protein